ncbi:hypothetical protein LG288_05910 [Idiomarina seosinensis]|uniref:hypothetical protein n=1 Tax=Idiomarina seosinensis TaxID=281739 RepID=UPI00384C0DD4
MEALAATPENLNRIKQSAGNDFNVIARQIAAKRVQFIDIAGCALVLRADGAELVIMCAEGKNLIKAAPIVIRKAREKGYRTMRFHTLRPALQRLLNKVLKFELTEYVYRARL